MSELASRECVPCKRGDPPLGAKAIERLATELGGGWSVFDLHHLEKTFSFPNFKEALAFANQVGELAEQAGHHPDLLVAWGKVGITLWTHHAKGLTESDFILAARIDQMRPANVAAPRESSPPTTVWTPDPEVMAALARMAGGVSHRLNNLLTIIQGNAALLEEVVQGPDAQFVGEIRKATNSVRDLSSQLVRISAPLSMDMALLDLKEWFETVRPQLAAQCNADVKLRASDQSLRFLGDRSLLEECLALAVRLSCRQETVRVEIEAELIRPKRLPLGVRGTTTGEFIRLRIAIPAAPFAEETPRRLFEPFGQSQNRGLEMALIHSIMSQHGGWIELESHGAEKAALNLFLPTAQ